MPSDEIASGQQRGWKLVQKLGEGDAGEVFLVESILDQNIAILKRPQRNAFTTDILRQANQIQEEGKILRVLAGCKIDNLEVPVKTPAFLDTSKPGNEYSERYFIIVEKAPGLNLGTLARTTHLLENHSIEPASLTSDEKFLVGSIKNSRKIPRLVLLRVLIGLIDFFESIHTCPSKLPDYEADGILWNDVKADHIFWNPRENNFFLIDWGNSQPLGSDGTSIDRRYSIISDYGQYLEEFGSFLTTVSPELYQQLDWPVGINPATVYSQGIKNLRKTLLEFLSEEQSRLQEIRLEEESLISTNQPTFANWVRLQEIQGQIQNFGEIPDWVGALRLAVQIARELVIAGERTPFIDLCEKAKILPGADIAHWELVLEIAKLNVWPGLFQLPVQQAILSALADDWAEALWQLKIAARESDMPTGWHDMSDKIRAAQPEIGPESITPLVALKRVILTLQAETYRKPAINTQSFFIPEADSNIENSPEVSLSQYLRDQIARRWIEYEPDPPYSGLDYSELEEHLGVLESILPASKLSIDKVLNQPKAQTSLILDAWDRRDFVTAQRGLRRLLLWDPDRLRVFLADQAISKVPAWLESTRKGPDMNESLPEFVTRCELRGREIRNQVGKSRWLDTILDAFTRLRKGASPSDILLDYPDLRSELIWLQDYHPPLITISSEPIVLERKLTPPKPSWLLQTSRMGALGEHGELWLKESLDTWAPEARGSSARVFLGTLIGEDHREHTAAIKLMRPDKIDYALPLFAEEAQVLTILRDVPGVCTHLEFGFIQFQEPNNLPKDDRTASAEGLGGNVYRLGPLEIQPYLRELETRVRDGWLPYLAFEPRDRKKCLITYCDSGYTQGRFLSLQESLRLAIQICEILHNAHTHSIVYRDHKILHYYWSTEENGVVTIDWNIAKRNPEGLTPAERTADLVQFGARALHHILTGRPSPGALPVGPNRPEEIDQAARFYQAQWNFDDQRLPTRLKEIIERTLAGEYDQASNLRTDLEFLYRDLTNES